MIVQARADALHVWIGATSAQRLAGSGARDLSASE